MPATKEFLIGDLVHIPASSQLVQHDAADTSQSQAQIVNKYMYSDTPSVGVVVSNKNLSHLEIYCYGDKWLIPTEKVFKLN